MEGEKSGCLLPDPPQLHLSHDIFKTTKLLTDFRMVPSIPPPNKDLGDLDSLNKIKAEITPHIKEWSDYIKFMISEYELIDVFKVPKYASQKYNESIINYRHKDDQNDKHGLYPIFSKGYFKLWEAINVSKCLSRYKHVPIRIANLAEGPGGFIHSLIDYRKMQHDGSWNKDRYVAITLKGNPEEKIHQDWEGKKSHEYFNYLGTEYNIKLSYGKDGTGNMFELANLDHFYQVDNNKQKCHVITADGGIDLCGDDEYSSQELINAKFFYTEILYALTLQEEGGTFVIKIYDILHDITIQFLLILTFYYFDVRVIKPYVCRAANSEKYVVCQGFRGVKEEEYSKMRKALDMWIMMESQGNYLNNSTFIKNLFKFDLAENKMKNWLASIAEFNQKLMKLQYSKIESGLKIITKGDMTSNQIQTIKKAQKDMAIAWCKKYSIPYKQDLKLTLISIPREGHFENRKAVSCVEFKST